MSLDVALESEELTSTALCPSEEVPLSWGSHHAPVAIVTSNKQEQLLTSSLGFA